MTTKDLSAQEFHAYYLTYIDQIDPSLELLEALRNGREKTITFFEGIPEAKLDFRYEENKWSIKEVLQHIIDTERVFVHRAFRIGRGDETPIPGFDQDTYIQPSRAREKSFKSLMEEYEQTRQFSLNVLGSLSEDDLLRTGVASENRLSARAAGFIIAGHELWHCKITKERYL